MKLFKIALSGHRLTLHVVAFEDPETEKTIEYDLQAVVHRNTRPGERPWRMTIFGNPQRASQLAIHQEMDSEYEYKKWKDKQSLGDSESVIKRMVGDYLDDQVISVEIT